MLKSAVWSEMISMVSGVGYGIRLIEAESSMEILVRVMMDDPEAACCD